MGDAEGGDAGEVREDAPNPMVLMGDILDKLKILGYEKFAHANFQGKGLLHSAYFVVPHPKPSEQFHLFTQIFAFLMGLNKFKFEAPRDEFEDPNSTVAMIMEALRSARMSIDYSQAKLRAGYGEAVCVVLNMLCDGALAHQNFRIGAMEYPEDVYPEEAPVDDDGEVSADIADTVADAEEEEDDEDYASEVKKDEGKETKIIESTIDPNAWKVEVEEVAPVLKMRLDQDNKEWRVHLDHTKELQESIDKKWGDDKMRTRDKLKDLSKTIEEAVESIKKREATINTRYKDDVAQYMNVQSGLQQVLATFEQRSREVQELQGELAEVTERLDASKAESNVRGESMTDTKPLKDLKKAMEKIKKEIQQMDLRVGTVSHDLLHMKLAHTSEKGHKSKNIDGSDDED